ncbi:hypothetical protein HPG69_018146 [Diceros bicornis minor]|uniref:Uncharacterized protein n=1 Tax=Diceros bicornis minor TaxID=77932 RepID=A0A7J7EJI9_DICBM|nr:hypothetical protein HPG69_018146 [Diceros bicornis minor]
MELRKWTRMGTAGQWVEKGLHAGAWLLLDQLCHGGDGSLRRAGEGHWVSHSGTCPSSLSGRACGNDSALQRQPLGAPQPLSVPDIDSTPAPRGAGRNETPDPSTDTLPYSRSPFSTNKPGSKQRMLGKDGAGSCPLTLDSEGFRQDGETKLEKETASFLVPWPRICLSFITWAKPAAQVGEGEAAPHLPGERALTQDGAWKASDPVRADWMTARGLPGVFKRTVGQLREVCTWIVVQVG